MVTVTKVIEWDMGHRVPNHKNKCQNPHGHRYRLEASIAGAIDKSDGSSSEGMVIDFGDIKEILTKYIHDPLDHAFMFYENDQAMKAFFSQEANQAFAHMCVPFIPTAENIVQWCAEQIIRQLPANLQLHHCRLYETPNSWADYHHKI